jgi:crossover junction endodeoxyribonuclease RuvC
VRPRPDLDLATRLHRIFDGLTGTIAEFSPQEAAVEVTFVNKNPASTLKLGQARGIAMLAPATTGISVSEYEPTTVKKTVTGGGRADKQQIRGMIGYLLPQAKPDSDDAADALAIAITHAHNRNAAILQRNTLAHAC